ncbi:MAG: hypothetical protein LBM96_02585 [Methanobrevibacter sp.]|jgi:hypothetical protein|nr:hypothetical protein [Candidatus Methanoflexus mossambicus]
MKTVSSNNKIIKNFQNQLNSNDLLENGISKIGKYLQSISPNYGINEVRICDDPSNFMEKIFVLIIPENISSKMRNQIETDVIIKTEDWTEENGVYNTFLETSIFVRK